VDKFFRELTRFMVVGTNERRNTIASAIVGIKLLDQPSAHKIAALLLNREVEARHPHDTPPYHAIGLPPMFNIGSDKRADSFGLKVLSNPSDLLSHVADPLTHSLTPTLHK
jgi:hypothetical protein